MNPDTLVIYRTRVRRAWRWKLTAANGERIGASTEGYRHRTDCIVNAARVLDCIPDDVAVCSTIHRAFHPEIDVSRHG